MWRKFADFDLLEVGGARLPVTLDFGAWSAAATFEHLVVARRIIARVLAVVAAAGWQHVLANIARRALVDLTGQVRLTAQDLAAQLAVRSLVGGERRLTPQWPVRMEAEFGGDDASAAVVADVLAVLPKRLVDVAGDDPLGRSLVVALLGDLLGRWSFVLAAFGLAGAGFVVAAEAAARSAAMVRRLACFGSWAVRFGGSRRHRTTGFAVGEAVIGACFGAVFHPLLGVDALCHLDVLVELRVTAHVAFRVALILLLLGVAVLFVPKIW